MTETTLTARFPAGNAAAARRFAERLSEGLDPDTTAVAAYERPDGGWAVEIHAAAGEDALRALVAAHAGSVAARTLTLERIAAKDWVAASLAGLPPVRAGRFFLHGAHDRAQAPVNRIAIEIEAALAFGTGHHGTTRGCLLALDRLLKARRPRRVLDLGTGTGVLAIAATKALRRSVLASDIDAQAVRVARANARANGTAARVAVLRGGAFANPGFRRRAPFDLIFANILLGPLQRLATPLRKHAAPGARIVLSGLLPAQANAALSAYRAQGLYLARRTDIEGWSTLVLSRSPARDAAPQ